MGVADFDDDPLDRPNVADFDEWDDFAKLPPSPASRPNVPTHPFQPPPADRMVIVPQAPPQNPEDVEEFIEVADGEAAMTIRERCYHGNCELLAQLLDIPNGQEIFDETFESGDSDNQKKKKKENVFMSNVLYAVRALKNECVLDVPYYYSKRTPGKGRLYAGNKNERGTAGQQMLRRTVRVFLQHTLYHDYDMVAAWPSILWMLCDKHNLICTLLKEFVKLCHAGRRNEFFRETGMTKSLFNAALNVDNWKARFNRNQKRCKRLTDLFEEIMTAKRALAKIYGPDGSVGGFCSNPAKPTNPVSSLVSLVLQDYENEALQTAMRTVKRIFTTGSNNLTDVLGPSGYDGFQLRQELTDREIKQLDTTGYIKWLEKPNISNVDVRLLKRKIMDAQSSMSNWEVPAEMYAHEVDGKPRVRPLCPASCHKNDEHMLRYEMNVGEIYPIKLMLRDEMSLGKTYQLFILILRQFTIRDARWLEMMKEYHLTSKDRVNDAADECTESGFPFMGEDVLIVYHRILLINSTCAKYWQQLGFKLYSDQESGPIYDTNGRWIVCIDSLHRFMDVTNYHLAAVDEFTETIQSMTRLETKGLGSGKWEVSKKLQTLLNKSENVVLMSAQADKVEKDYLDGIGVDLHWQMNEAKPLDQLQYEFSHFENESHEFKPIYEALDEGKKVVIPCSEKDDLLKVLKVLEERYPGKKFLAIYGQGLSDDERKRRVQLAEREGFDAILFTSSMDCGVSIELQRRVVNTIGLKEHAYDLVIFRLNVRSINANQVMQMILRVRNLNDKKIIFICDRLVKDWDHLPGYDYELLKEDDSPVKTLPPGCSPIIEGYNNLTEVRRATYLPNRITADVFYWKSPRKKTWYRWSKRVPKPEITKNEMTRYIIRPAAIEEVLSVDGYVPQSLRALVKDADRPVLQMAIQSTYAEYMPLRRCPARPRCTG